MSVPLLIAGVAGLSACTILLVVIVSAVNRSTTGPTVAARAGGAKKAIKRKANPRRDSKAPVADVPTDVVSGSGAPAAGAQQPCPSWAARNPNPMASAMTDTCVQRAKSDGRVNVAFVGDSITQLLNDYKTAMDQCAKGLGSKNRIGIHGVAGDVVENVVWRFCQAFPVADAYVIMIGTNNISVTSSTDYVSRVFDLIKFIRARNATAHIVCLAVFWRHDRMDVVTAANKLLEDYVRTKTDNRTHYAPWGTTLAMGDMQDGLHPTEPGWIKVLTKLTPYLASLLT